ECTGSGRARPSRRQRETRRAPAPPRTSQNDRRRGRPCPARVAETAWPPDRPAGGQACCRRRRPASGRTTTTAASPTGGGLPPRASPLFDRLIIRSCCAERSFARAPAFKAPASRHRRRHQGDRAAAVALPAVTLGEAAAQRPFDDAALA